MGKYAKCTSFIKDAVKEIYREDKSLRGKAAQLVKERIKAKINKTQPSLPGEPPGKVTGNLLKGLSTENKKTVALVGFKAPAHHAMLLELGTKKMRARPMLFSTFEEEAGAIREILSGQRA